MPWANEFPPSELEFLGFLTLVGDVRVMMIPKNVTVLLKTWRTAKKLI